MMEKKGFMPGEVAAVYGLNVQTIRRAIRSHALRAYKIGRRVIVLQADIDQWIERGATWR